MPENEFRIIVDLSEASGTAGGAGTAPIADVPAASQIPAESADQAQRGAYRAIAISGVKKAISIYQTLQMTEITTISGRTQLAQRQQIVNNLFNSGLDMAISGVSGGAIATALGASGAVGAAIGIAALVGDKAIPYMVASEQLGMSRQVENENLREIRTRAGAAFNRSRTNN